MSLANLNKLFLRLVSTPKCDKDVLAVVHFGFVDKFPQDLKSQVINLNPHGNQLVWIKDQ